MNQKTNAKKKLFLEGSQTESAEKIGKKLEESKNLKKIEDKNFISQLTQLQLKCSTVKMQKCISFQSKLRTASIV